MLTTKMKTVYVCQQCAASFPKWSGQCAECHSWNTLVEEQQIAAPKNKRFSGYAGKTAGIYFLSDIQAEEKLRLPTHSEEFDRVLGGGLVAGSVVLIGGDPGIGKSTLLLETCAYFSRQQTVIYVTGEESLQQVRLRALRLGLDTARLYVMAETQVETVLAEAAKLKPDVMVIDSVQTMQTMHLTAAPGSVSQVRDSAAELVRYAKTENCAIFLVGHVTKEGNLAGPRVLEHMVDTVLYFEGSQEHRYRVVRAIKNRFGAVNELAIFAMSDKGLRAIANPSAIFLTEREKRTPGQVIMATWEGTRPLLVEVQALVAETPLANPRRVCVGLEQNRLALLLAVLNRHGRILTYNQDVFVNVVGGMRIQETAADLAQMLAVVSSFKNRVLPANCVIFGEVGLAGEIRPVQAGLERLHEAAKHGFVEAIVPKANAPKKGLRDMKIHAVENISQALEYVQ